MHISKTISIVRRYAEEWNIPNLGSFQVERDRTLFWTVAHRVYYNSDDWTGFAYVEARASMPVTFDFRPKRLGILMPPLWAAYPTYHAATIGWRMNGGEDYRHAWWTWYEALTDSQQKDYQCMFPVPTDDRAWNLYFYNVDEPDDVD